MLHGANLDALRMRRRVVGISLLLGAMLNVAALLPSFHVDFNTPYSQAKEWPVRRITTYYLLTTYYSLLTTYYLLLTTYYVLLTTYYLLLTTYYLLLTTYYLLLTTYYLLLTTYY